MRDKKVLLVRICIFITVFIAFFWISLDWILKEIKETSYRWHPNIFTIALIITVCTTLAYGVSFLSELFEKKKIFIKTSSGILTGIVFILTLLPQKENANQTLPSTAFILSIVSSILISWLSTRECMHIKKKIKWFFPSLFALFSGIYGVYIPAFLFRGYYLGQGGYLFIVCGSILIVFCLIMNYFIAFKLNKQNQG